MCGIVSGIAPASGSGRARSSDPRCSAERPKRGWIVPIAGVPLGAIAGIAFGMDEIHWTIEPGAVYHYSVGGDPDHTFRTLPPSGRNFVVYVEGDIGDAASCPHGAAVQEPIAQDDPWFVLVVGDLTHAEEHDLDAVDNPNAPAEG